MIFRSYSIKTAIQLSCLLVFFTAFAGCKDEVKAPWRLDAKYSHYLTTMAWDYKAITGHDSASTVDGMLIYKIVNERNRMFSLDELSKRDILYESRDKEFIRKFLEAAQDGARPTPSGPCQSDPDKAAMQERALHVILLDNTFMRAGYFIVTNCKTLDSEYANVHTMLGTYYRTKSLLPLIRAIDPVLRHDKK